MTRQTFIVLALIVMPLHAAFAEEIEFSLENARQVEETMQRRTLAIQAATSVLSDHAVGKPTDEDLVCRAAEVLGKLRAGDDPRAIQALVANLDFSPSISVGGEPDALATLIAARALRQIGGRVVIDALVRSLRTKRTKKEHLIVANILASCDSAPVAAYRVRLAIEAEQRQKQPDLDYLAHLKAVKHWLDNPELLDAASNWPTHM